MRRLIVVVAAALALLILPRSASSTIDLRCDRLVREINLYRDPDLRIRSILCDIARLRSKQYAAGYLGPNGDGHDIKQVARRLTNAGVCWRNVGEAIAWTTAKYDYASEYARRFVKLWRESPDHWPMLSGTRYDRAGGGFSYGLYSRTYAVVIVMDAC